jgi:hypothetical protein
MELILQELKTYYRNQVGIYDIYKDEIFVSFIKIMIKTVLFHFNYHINYYIINNLYNLSYTDLE